MKLYLRNIEAFIKMNNLKEVTDPVILNQGYIPTDGGLLSTSIFGSTPKERKHRYAYIDLKGHFLHPLVYKNIKRMDRRIEYIASGTKKYTIDKSGYLIEDENGNTGLEWLYSNWDKIKFKETGTRTREKRIDFLKIHDKKVLFQKYEIVMPAFYRDINLQNAGSGKPSIHEVNRFYTKLIRLAQSLDMTNDYSFVLNNTRYMIQQTLVEIYNYFEQKTAKKTGIIRKSVLGKSVDYGSRLVIAAPEYNYNTYKDAPITFKYMGVPLSSFCVTAYPFFIGWIRDFLNSEFELTGYKYPYYDKETDSVKYVKLKNVDTYFNDEYILKMIKKYIYSYSERFETIDIPNEENLPLKLAFRGKILGSDETKFKPELSPLGNRPMTITDLLFLAASDISSDKHEYITRYPIADFMSIFPKRTRILSTIETVKMEYNGKVYQFYPKVDLSMTKDQVSKYFIDVGKMQNTNLSAIGGDYDGDQVSDRTVYSQEANLEAEKIIDSKINYLSVNGNIKRTTTNEAIQTLYMLTKN